LKERGENSRIRREGLAREGSRGSWRGGFGGGRSKKRGEKSQREIRGDLTILNKKTQAASFKTRRKKSRAGDERRQREVNSSGNFDSEKSTIVTEDRDLRTREVS